MAETTGEQDRSEEATPFKLQQARRKGMLARGTDLGFLSALIALAIITQTSGRDLVAELQVVTRHSLTAHSTTSGNHDWIMSMIAQKAIGLATIFILPGLILFTIVLIFELIQNRGVIFTAKPLKPDFTKLNPAKGLKRLFSIRMLKELGKNLTKLMLYGAGAIIFTLNVAYESGRTVRSGRDLADVLVHVSGRLLLLFIILAAIIVLIDQVVARREFAKQMRMSRRELKREVREREGEPRQKQKRKQILEEILKQTTAAANVKGADVLIVNPIHYAVALRYRPDESEAPIIQARGRNIWAWRMRQTAESSGITIVHNPLLARALYRFSKIGQPIRQTEFVAVADIYIMLRRNMRQKVDN